MKLQNLRFGLRMDDDFLCTSQYRPMELAESPLREVRDTDRLPRVSNACLRESTRRIAFAPMANDDNPNHPLRLLRGEDDFTGIAALIPIARGHLAHPGPAPDSHFNQRPHGIAGALRADQFQC